MLRDELGTVRVRSPANTVGTTAQAERRIIESWASDVDRQAEALRAEIASLPRAPKAEPTVVGVGTTWTDAIEDIGWHDGDVLVVGSSSIGPVARVFMGSHATKVVRHSPVPVVVVPRREIDTLISHARRD